MDSLIDPIRKHVSTFDWYWELFSHRQSEEENDFIWKSFLFLFTVTENSSRRRKSCSSITESLAVDCRSLGTFNAIDSFAWRIIDCCKGFLSIWTNNNRKKNVWCVDFSRSFNSNVMIKLIEMLRIILDQLEQFSSSIRSVDYVRLERPSCSSIVRLTSTPSKFPIEISRPVKLTKDKIGCSSSSIIGKRLL